MLNKTLEKKVLHNQEFIYQCTQKIQSSKYLNIQHGDYLYWTEDNQDCAGIHMKQNIQPSNFLGYSCDDVAVYRVHYAGKKHFILKE